MEFSPEGPMAIPLWLNGHALMTVTESFFDVLHPVSGVAMRRVPLCGAPEAGEVVAAARQAQAQWADMGMQARRLCLAGLGDALDGYAGHFAKLLMQESAGDETQAVAEVAAAVDALHSAAVGETGVYGLVLDPHRPLAGLAASLAPALMAGATVVVKPSPKAPSAAYALCELSGRIGWPAGVLNLLQGDTAAILGLCGAGIDRLVYVGAPTLGAQVGMLAAAQGTPFVMQDA